jgi:hypothetical protein
MKSYFKKINYLFLSLTLLLGACDAASSPESPGTGF